MDEPWHGTSGGYSNHKCRCPPCTEAWRVLCAQMKEKRRRKLNGEAVSQSSRARSTPLEHGTEATYTNWTCRCADCTEAHRVYNASQR